MCNNTLLRHTALNTHGFSEEYMLSFHVQLVFSKHILLTTTKFMHSGAILISTKISKNLTLKAQANYLWTCGGGIYDTTKQ